MLKAEKNKEKVDKDKMKRLKDKLLDPIELMEEKRALMAQYEKRDNLTLLREASEKDLKEKERIKEL